MPDGYVEFGRWDEAHRATLLRLMSVEQRLEDLRGAEQVHESMKARIFALEAAEHGDEAAERSKADRRWTLIALAIGSFVMPLAVTVLVTFLHLKSVH